MGCKIAIKIAHVIILDAGQYWLYTTSLNDWFREITSQGKYVTTHIDERSNEYIYEVRDPKLLEGTTNENCIRRGLSYWDKTKAYQAQKGLRGSGPMRRKILYRE